MKPADADFGVTVDFTRGVSDPVVVFEGITTLLEGFRQLDKVTIGALDPEIEPIMVLEDVEAASITAWIRNRLRQVDDQALKELDWRPQVGKYAVKAKYRVLEYLDERERANEAARLGQLREDLEQLAREADIRHIPLHAPIALGELTASLDRIQDAKRLLESSNRLIIKTEDREYEVDLTSSGKRPSAFLPAPVDSTHAGTMQMTLLVRKPDYLGNSLWEFRHGKEPVEAHVRDEDWLERFRSGQVLIAPGSALSCLVAYEYGYDTDGELRTRKHDVVKVFEVIHNPPGTQQRFPGT